MLMPDWNRAVHTYMLQVLIEAKTIGGVCCCVGTGQGVSGCSLECFKRQNIEKNKKRQVNGKKDTRRERERRQVNREKERGESKVRVQRM